MDRSLGIPPIVSMERQFTYAQRVADAYGDPLWSGEYGYWGDDADRIERLSRYADLEDAHLLGSAYWVWRQGCGDPQGGLPDVTDALQRTDCTTGDAAPPREDLLGILGPRLPAFGTGHAHLARRRTARMSTSPARRTNAAAGSRCGSPARRSPSSTPPGSRTSRPPPFPAAGS